METLNSSTQKLLKATERLLQDFETERAGRKGDREKAEERIVELEAQVEKLSADLENALSDSKKASDSHISNPLTQSHDTVALKAENIDALVEEIDACLNLLKI
jgi:seryl-tRNA synthetase